MKPKNSLERVLAVLEVFCEERLEWTPEDLMRELGYSRPTLYRYLKILKDAGFLMSTEGRRDGLSDAARRSASAPRRALSQATHGGSFLHRDGAALVRQQDPLRSV
jgi:DNA-binding IclR family transcriptional regulator